MLFKGLLRSLFKGLLATLPREQRITYLSMQTAGAGCLGWPFALFILMCVCKCQPANEPTINDPSISDGRKKLVLEDVSDRSLTRWSVLPRVRLLKGIVVRILAQALHMDAPSLLPFTGWWA